MILCPRVHFKSVIVDGRFVFSGSANLTDAGMGAKGYYQSLQRDILAPCKGSLEKQCVVCHPGCCPFLPSVTLMVL